MDVGWNNVTEMVDVLGHDLNISSSNRSQFEYYDNITLLEKYLSEYLQQDGGPDSFTLFNAIFTVDPHYVTLIEKYQVTNNQRGASYYLFMVCLIIVLLTVMVI